MHGPIRVVRSNQMAGYKNLGPIYEWLRDQSYLIIDRASFRGKEGVILCHHNPPVHQVGTPGLHAYMEGLDQVIEKVDGLDFLILYGANDPVHTGGDLKESLNKLEETLKIKREKGSACASTEELAQLFNWGEDRLRKGVTLYGKIRKIAQYLRVIALCGGGTRYGGSAEIPLMSDYIIGDSRSGMCFSEAMIGLIPAWAGIARILIKAGLHNTEYMTKTAKVVNAYDLKGIGVYHEVVDIPFPLPKLPNTGNPEADQKIYLDELEANNDSTGLILLPKGLELATCPIEKISIVDERERKILATKEEIALEVAQRVKPDNYFLIWGKPLKEVKEEIAKLGRPLAPQSIRALDGLFEGFEASMFDEKAFVEKELMADSALYRDPRFFEGLKAMLEQRIPDFRVPDKVDLSIIH